MLWLDVYLGTFGGRSLVGRRSVRVWASWLALLVGVAVVLWLVCRLGLVAGWSVRVAAGLPTGAAGRFGLARGRLKRGGGLGRERGGPPRLRLTGGRLVGLGWSWLVGLGVVGWFGRSVGRFGRSVGCLLGLAGWSVAWLLFAVWFGGWLVGLFPVIWGWVFGES